MPSTLLSGGMYTANSSSNTAFREYGTAISNAFANAGWVQASDPGQIDWTTVVANGTSTAYVGSEIWRMNDALANVAPVYVKIDYGTGSGIGRPSIIVTLGTSSNGNVGLGGVVSSSVPPAMQSGFTTAAPGLFVGGPSYIGIGLFLGWTYPWLMGIERTRDENGDDTAEGCLFMTGNSITPQLQYWNCKTGATVREDVGIFLGKPDTPGYPQGTGQKFNWGPIYGYRGSYTNPSMLFIQGTIYHFAANAVSTVTHYGQERQYVGLWGIGGTNRSGIAAAHSQMLMMWE